MMMIIRIQRIWNMKHFVIPVIIGDAEIVTKGLKISINNTKKSIQYILYKNTAVLETSHIIRKGLQSEA